MPGCMRLPRLCNCADAAEWKLQKGPDCLNVYAVPIAGSALSFSIRGSDRAGCRCRVEGVFAETLPKGTSCAAFVVVNPSVAIHRHHRHLKSLTALIQSTEWGCHRKPCHTCSSASQHACCCCTPQHMQAAAETATEGRSGIQRPCLSLCGCCRMTSLRRCGAICCSCHMHELYVDQIKR